MDVTETLQWLSFARDSTKVGNLSIGIAGNYLQVWRFSLGYTHFFGPEGTFVENRHVSYKQALKDRNFISLSVNRTF
ncbi:hypothetical protein ALISP_0561 [Alicycliphilus sp. B1]|nr:hypothetical protein ALISP_0561 [Alicycliphilus sp. B1]